MRRLRWESTPRPVPKHPYRDTAILYGILAVILVGVTALTNGNVLRSVYYALGLFVAATAWGWYRWRERLRRADLEDEK